MAELLDHDHHHHHDHLIHRHCNHCFSDLYALRVHSERLSGWLRHIFVWLFKRRKDVINFADFDFDNTHGKGLVKQSE